MEDNFDELVNAVDSSDCVSPNGKQTDTAEDIQTGTADKGDAPEVTEITEDPIRGNPVGPSTPPGAVSSKFVLCKGKDSPATRTGNTPVSAKGSPFTRYSIKTTDPPKKQGKSDTCAVTSETKSPENSDPQDTGATRLERLLAEAAEEAANKQIQLSSNLMVSESAETDERGGLGGRPETEAITVTNPPDVVGDNHQPSDSSSDSSTDSDLEVSSTEEFVVTPEKPLRKRKAEKTTGPVKKRAKPQHMLAEWMYDKYPILRFFATAPSDAARHPNKYRCRVCMVELSLKTKGPLEMLRHYRTDAHLVREHRIRMETPGLALFDKQCIELSGMALKYAKERAKREYPIAPKLGDYYLRVDQQELPDKTEPDTPDKETLSQLTLLKFGLRHGGRLDSLIALWHDLITETRTSEPVSTHDWRPHRILVSCFGSGFCLQKI